jgi:hypothetical protein
MCEKKAHPLYDRLYNRLGHLDAPKNRTAR